MNCGRCRKPIAEGERREFCWWCEGNLCGPCWEAVGHCGHARADYWNEKARQTDGAERFEQSKQFMMEIEANELMKEVGASGN